MLKPFLIFAAATTLTACGGGGGPVDYETAAVGAWTCKVKTLVDGKVQSQPFDMTLTEDKKAVLVSKRYYRQPGASLTYTQTSTGTWKTGGERFGLDNLTHEMELIKARGKDVRALSKASQESFARRALREQLQPIEKIRYDIILMAGGRFNMTEGEDAVKTLCAKVKEEAPKEDGEATEEVVEEVPENTKSSLYN